MEKNRTYVNGIYTKDGRKVIVVKLGEDNVYLPYSVVVKAIAEADKKEYDIVVKRNEV